MDAAVLELAAKTVALFAAVITAYKLFLEVVLHRKSRLRDEHRFIRDYLSDVFSTEAPHPYLVESGFKAISGNDELTATEILFFLKQPNPSISIKRYSAARKRYVEYSHAQKRVTFRGRFVDAAKRKRSVILNGLGYFVLALLALAPLFFASNIFGKNWQMAIVFIPLSLAAFGPQAILCLVEVGRIRKGETLVEQQQNPNNPLNQDAPHSGAPVS